MVSKTYFYALTAPFGQGVTQPEQRAPVWQVAPQLLYAQLRKVRAGYTLKYTFTRVLLGTREVLKHALQALALSGKITTAFVERLNLTLRELIAPLSRRTGSLAHDESTLATYVAWGRTDSHFARYHQALRRPTATGRLRSRTPAMAAGLAHRRYTVQELLAWSLPG